MKRRSCLLAFFVSLLLTGAAGAQDPLGSVAAVFSYAPSKLLADPSRNRVYAADPASNSVIVFDTTTVQASATIPVGSDPVDMAISPDGATLYVANGGSTLAAVSVIDLGTLTVRATYALPGVPLAIAAGLNGRVYASAGGSYESTIYQFDGATGTMQTTFNHNYYDNNFFQISPDEKTLFVASTSGSLESFDVSTATPVALQVESQAGDNSSQLVVSHNGEYLCLPSGGGNPGAGGYSTALFATSDITSFYGSFVNGAYPGPLAFSPGDSLVYQTRAGDSAVLDVFSTQTFAKLAEVPVPADSESGYPYDPGSTVTDYTGSYLFISESTFDGNSTVGQLAVLTTGAGTLTPPSIVPVITSATTANATKGTASTYQITAANTPTSFNATSLPAGLSVDTTTGLISGTPTTIGSYDVTISAANASGTATAPLTLYVTYSSASYIPVITTSSQANGVVGRTYSQAVTATNGANNYSATGLPVGLSINASTGTISGVPTTVGFSTITLEAANNYGTATTSLSLMITTPLPVITSGTAAGGVLGGAFSYQIAATNPPSSFAASGLPAGLSLNATTGVISGVPTTLGAFSVILSATNVSGTGTASLSITVAMAPPVISSLATDTAILGQAFAYQIAASNAPTSYSASGLPTGLSINTVSGLISGTTLAAGTFPVTLGATNAGGTGTLVLSLAVNPALPDITGNLSVDAMQGQAFSYQITAGNGPTSYTASGLPDGLSLDGSTGLISGVPTQIGHASVVLGAVNAGGTGTATLSLTVNPFIPVVSLVATTPTVTAGSGDSGEILLTLSSAAAGDVVVDFSIKGTASNGTDYVLLKTTKKIKAGRTQKIIKITPLESSGGTAKKVVTLSLAPGNGYIVGPTFRAKVRILAP